jgi:enoyl-CoA hydratase/carnithine racemase
MTLRYEKADGIATITIDNPPVNVFTPALHRVFFGLLEDFLRDREVRVGILTGAGQRAFCAGDDIKSPRRTRSTGEVIERFMFPIREEDEPEYPGWEAEVKRLSERRYKPIVAAVNGAAMGQGLIYLLQLTDLRLATPNAIFGLPEIAYGMAGASGSTQLGRVIPQAAALWLALTGDPFDAEAALRHGLINEIVAPDALMGRAREVASRIARHPPIAVRTEMEAFYKARDMTREQATSYVGNLYRLQRAAVDPTPPLLRRDATSEA